MTGIDRSRGGVKWVFNTGTAAMSNVWRVAVKRPDTALAENDLRITIHCDDLRGLQQLFERGGHPSLQQHWPPTSAQLFSSSA